MIIENLSFMEQVRTAAELEISRNSTHERGTYGRACSAKAYYSCLEASGGQSLEVGRPPRCNGPLVDSCSTTGLDYVELNTLQLLYSMGGRKITWTRSI
jgi:hypothetical protein